MTIEQTTFLGASISSFSLSLGWKSTPSSLTCRLVEDTTNGDSFNPGVIGGAKIFEFGDFSFRGILQSWKQNNSIQGSPVFDIVLVDPRELLSGVQLIIDEYNGGVYGVPNVYNVFGALEAIRYGNSGVNESGMSWSVLANKTTSMILESPMLFRGFGYTIDMSALPRLTDYYRVKGPVLSLLDFIGDVCDAALHDYFFSLQSGGVITLHTVDRSTEPQLNKISNYVSSVEGAVSKEVGLELRNEPCSKMVIGGPVEELFFQPRWLLEDQDNPEESADSGKTEVLNTIWPFWGFDINGNAILARGVFENPNTPELIASGQRDHIFQIDSRFLDAPGIGELYEITLMELRCALISQEVWEAYIWLEKPDLALQIGLTAGPASLKTFLDAAIRAGTPGVAVKDITAGKFAGLFGHMFRKAGTSEEKDIAGEKINMLYQHIYGISQNYGRKFMVRIPDVYVTVEPETNLVKTSLEPVNAGYFAESIWQNAINYNLAPPLIERLTTQEGQIQAYVRYDNAQALKLTEINEEDMIFSADGYSVFIKCDVDPKIVFIQVPTGSEDEDDNNVGGDDNSGRYSARAVITLPGPIRAHDFDPSAGPCGLLNYFITNRIDALLGLAPGPAADILEDMKEYFGSMVGADGAMFGTEQVCYIPQLAVVPLRNPRLSYGPWYAAGNDGATEIEIDPTLVPWNYGGFTVMNAVGQSRVAEAIANGQVAETGTVEVPGTPTVSLGGQLISGGPYVTDINVSIDPNGVTTTYRMETWTRRFGKWAKSNEERLQKFGKLARESRKNIRESSFIPAAGSKYYKIRKESGFPNRFTHRSSSIFAASHIYEKEDGTRQTSTSFIPDYYAGNFLSSDYEHKALMSLDGLFRPFSTKTDASGIPHFELPSGTSSVITSSGLNPLKMNHDISIVTHDTQIANNKFITDDIDYDNERGVALRGPLVIAGWGYDTNEKPVPNSTPNSPGTSFLTDYLQRSDMWKCGPLDTRWDNQRKVWVAGGDTITYIKTAYTFGFPNTPAIGSGYIVDITTGVADTSKLYRTYSSNSFITQVGVSLFINESAAYVKRGEYYYPISNVGDLRPGIAQEDVPGSSGNIRVFPTTVSSSPGDSIVMNAENLTSNIILADAHVLVHRRYFDSSVSRWVILDGGCQ